MNSYANALSDNELDAISGGADDATVADVKAAVAHGAGLAPLDIAAWLKAVKAMK
jgi:bacteriocin-like protein